MTRSNFLDILQLALVDALLLQNALQERQRPAKREKIGYTRLIGAPI
jgi:hypothetical protein